MPVRSAVQTNSESPPAPAVPDIQPFDEMDDLADD
jgi:hypothetical protein